MQNFCTQFIQLQVRNIIILKKCRKILIMIIIMQIEGLESLNSVTISDATDTDGLKRIKKWIYCRGLNDFFLVNKICSFSIHFEPPHRTAVSICDVRISDRETRLNVKIWQNLTMCLDSLSTTQYQGQTFSMFQYTLCITCMYNLFNWKTCFSYI